MLGTWRQQPDLEQATRLLPLLAALSVIGPMIQHVASLTTLAAEPAHDSTSAAAEQLVRELDDDSFEVRRRAHRELIALGEPALTAVRRARTSDSAEVRARARDIACRIEHDRLLRAFRHLATATDDADLDLEAGLVLVAQIVNSEASREPLAEALDALAERVRKRLPQPAEEADPRAAVEALRHVLFVEEGFDGNRNDYENPVNSSLAHVLSTKRGLPILLSQVVIAVGRRVDLPLVGLALPGRFMVLYDDQRPKPPTEQVDLVIDPFEAGKVMSMPELREYLPNLQADQETIRRLLEPAGNRLTLVRVLNNLANAYTSKEDYRRAREVEAYREVLLANSDNVLD